MLKNTTCDKKAPCTGRQQGLTQQCQDWTTSSRMSEDVAELVENERTYDFGKVINKSNDKGEHQGPMNHLEL